MVDRCAELRQTILTAQNELNTSLDSLQSGEWGRPSSNEGWSAKDTLAHLASIEARQQTQVRAILDGTIAFPVDDVNEFNEREVAKRRDWTLDRLRSELTQEQAATLALLEQVKEEDLDRYFDHPRRGRLSIDAILQNLARHTRTHASEIMAVRSAG